MQNKIKTYENSQDIARKMTHADPDIYKWIGNLHTSQNNYKNTIKGLDIRKLAGNSTLTPINKRLA